METELQVSVSEEVPCTSTDSILVPSCQGCVTFKAEITRLRKKIIATTGQARASSIRIAILLLLLVVTFYSKNKST